MRAYLIYKLDEIGDLFNDAADWVAYSCAVKSVILVKVSRALMCAANAVWRLKHRINGNE